jgi:hypothetical protein
MDHYEDIIDSTMSGGINEQVRADLRGAGGWAMFLAILGFIGGGIMILAGVIMMVAGAAGGLAGTDNIGAWGGMSVGLMGGMYFVLSVFYLLPSWLLFRFASNARKVGDHPEAMGLATGSLRKFFMVMGVMVIVGVGLYILALIGFVVMGVMAF